MNELEKAVDALKNAFIKSIEDGGGTVGSGKDDVKMPNDKIWINYAEAVIKSLKE